MLPGALRSAAYPAPENKIATHAHALAKLPPMREVFICLASPGAKSNRPEEAFSSCFAGTNPVYIMIQDSNGLALGAAKRATGCCPETSPAEKCLFRALSGKVYAVFRPESAAKRIWRLEDRLRAHARKRESGRP